MLEICAGDIRSVCAAKAGGADRVELCSALGEGGVTPSYGLIEQSIGVGIRVHVLVRPRGGDFVYNRDEVDLMVADIRHAAKAGAHGIVIGALKPNGEIDITSCQRLIEAAQGMSITFHRAFDLCADPFKALDDIIALGCHRILTSGLAATALKGVPTLRKLVERAGNDIIILPGGGVNPANAAEILCQTGAKELHASARATYPSAMQFKRSGVSMGAPDSNEYLMKYTSPETVAQIVAAMKTVLP